MFSTGNLNQLLVPVCNVQAPNYIVAAGKLCVRANTPVTHQPWKVFLISNCNIHQLLVPVCDEVTPTCPAALSCHRPQR